MHHDRERPNTGRVESASAGPAVEDHGRVVTANFRAAAFIGKRNRPPTCPPTVKALRHAVIADPGFGLAVADLAAFTETSPEPMVAVRRAGNAITLKWSISRPPAT